MIGMNKGRRGEDGMQQGGACLSSPRFRTFIPTSGDSIMPF